MLVCGVVYVLPVFCEYAWQVVIWWWSVYLLCEFVYIITMLYIYNVVCVIFKYIFINTCLWKLTSFCVDKILVDDFFAQVFVVDFPVCIVLHIHKYTQYNIQLIKLIRNASALCASVMCLCFWCSMWVWAIIINHC